MKNKRNAIILISILSIFASSCVLSGYDALRYDEENQCWSPEEIESEFVWYGRTCGGSITFAKEDGYWWQFLSTCLPEGYKARTVPFDIGSKPDCD